MIRESTAADLDDLTVMFDSYRVFHGAQSNIEGCAKFLASRLGHGDSKIFLACVDGHPVGFAQLYSRYASLKLMRNWLLADLFILPGHRRQGLARKLVMHSLAFAHESGADALHASTDESNDAALALYRSCGFELVGGTVILFASIKG